MQKTNAALAGLMLLAAPAWATQQAVYSPQPVVVDGNGQDAVWADAKQRCNHVLVHLADFGVLLGYPLVRAVVGVKHDALRVPLPTRQVTFAV